MSTENQNKVQYGFKNAYYAVLTETEDQQGNIIASYGTPKKLGPGRTAKADPKAESEDYYADDSILDTFATMDGYDVEIAVTEIPEDFKTDVLGDVKDENGMLLENPTGKTNPFALLFEFDGDAKARRHVFYNCKATRPSLEGATSEGKIDPKEQTIKITAKKSPAAAIGRVKASTTSTTKAEVYNAWYTAVQLPGEVSGDSE